MPFSGTVTHGAWLFFAKRRHTMQTENPFTDSPLITKAKKSDLIPRDEKDDDYRLLPLHVITSLQIED
jgi:hypothetical protein